MRRDYDFSNSRKSPYAKQLKRQITIRVLPLVGLVAAGANGNLARGQILHATGDRPSFEVATIKPWKRTPSPPPPPDGATAPAKVMKVAPADAGPAPTGRVHVTLPMSILIESAYNLPVGSGRILGGPDWLRQDIDQFELQAKIEDSEYATMQKNDSGTAARAGCFNGTVTPSGPIQVEGAFRNEGDARVCTDGREGRRKAESGKK
jgi:hypothetical protein